MQLFASISRGKTPLHLDVMSITSSLPWLDNGPHTLNRGQALCQALPSQDRQFNLSHVQPAVLH